MIATVSLGDLAERLGAKLAGDANCRVSGAAALGRAQAGQASFIEKTKYIKQLSNTQASVVLLPEAFLDHCPTNALIVEKPRLAFASLLSFLYPSPSPSVGIHPTAVIGQQCQIHPSATIGPYVVLGDRVCVGQNTVLESHCSLGPDVVVGADSYFYPGVRIYHGTIVGSRVLLHSGVVLGSDGFGFEMGQSGSWVKVPQIGRVIIGNDVEIGANTAIDRGALDDTRIGHGVKIDNQVMIGHNVEVGDHTIISGCTGIAGSVKIGRWCIIGGSCTIKDHIEIADQVILTGMTTVGNSITTPGMYSSALRALPYHQWMKTAVRFKQLDSIYQRLQQLERESHDHHDD